MLYFWFSLYISPPLKFIKPTKLLKNVAPFLKSKIYNYFEKLSFKKKNFNKYNSVTALNLKN